MKKRNGRRAKKKREVKLKKKITNTFKKYFVKDSRGDLEDWLRVLNRLIT